MTSHWLFVSLLGLALVSRSEAQGSPPEWRKNLSDLVIPEDQDTHVTLPYRLEAVDPDEDVVVYTITDGPLRVVNNVTGEIELTSPLDYEDQVSYVINVIATDGIHTVERLVTVRVLDVNDEPPVISLANDTVVFTVPESLPTGSLIIPNITVTDVDETNAVLQLRCAIPQQAAVNCSSFEVRTLVATESEWRGSVYLARELTYDSNNPCLTLVLEAQDGVNNSTQDVSVCVTDVDDLPPVFTSSLTASVLENIGLGREVLRVAAVDADVTDRPIRYSLLSNPGGFFDIDAQSGSIVTAKLLSTADANFEGGFILIQVKASEVIAPGVIGNDRRTTTVVTVTISVEDANDHAPTFQESRYSASILENMAVDTPLPGLSMTVTDADQGSNAEFSLTLANYADIFAVQPSLAAGRVSATILVKQPESLDHESSQLQYILQVVARETRTNETLSSTAQVIVNILDENDNDPSFRETSYSASVIETAPGLTPIIHITATDKDSGINGVAGIRYRLIGNGADRFKVKRTTGQVSVADCATPGSGNCLDYEGKKVYSLTLEAWDRFGEGNRGSVPLTINILGDNDNRPQFTLDNYVTYVNEGNTTLSPPVRVQATDLDRVPGDQHLTYSIIARVPATPDNQFQIDPLAGVITARQPVQYPRETYYLLTVKVSDPDFSDTSQVTIYVNDLNNNGPVFTQGGVFGQSIREDTPPGTDVLQVTATDDDPDTGPNGQIEYRISSGAQDKFVIDVTSGQVSVAPGAAFDTDDRDVYTLIVVASDKGQPRMTSSASAIITILDINNKSPYFRPSTITTTVYENATQGTVVANLTARDPDVDARLSYSFVEYLTATDPQGSPVNSSLVDFMNWFRLEPLTGAVSVNGLLNRDLVSELEIRVQVDDLNGQTDQAGYGTLIITILKLNDKAPYFEDPWRPDFPYLNATMREEEPTDALVIVASATDDNGISEYRLISNPNQHLRIHPRTGEVSILRPIDYEEDQRVEAVITAVDNGDPQLTSTATLVIVVTNSNDNSPVFFLPLYEETIPENSPANTPVLRVNATDLDLGDFGNVRYELTDPMDEFVIDEETGLISVKPGAVLDRETTPEIRFTVGAYDSPADRALSRYATVPVVVTLSDVNDEPPTFDQPLYEAVVDESSPVPTPVITVAAVDEDDMPSLTYSITDGNDQGFFDIDPSTGLISTNMPLQGRVAQYNLTIYVTDATGDVTPSHNATTRVIISVIDNNDGPPVWVNPDNNDVVIEVLENENAGTDIDYDFLALDNETDVRYRILHDGRYVSDDGDFRIDPSSGVVSTTRPFDRELTDTYKVVLAATDFGNPPLTSFRTVTFRVLDDNDNRPTFPVDDMCCTVGQNITIFVTQPVDRPIGQSVVAMDPDEGDNAEIIYEITEGNDDGVFYVDAKRGTLYLSRPLADTTKRYHRVRITARNNLTMAAPPPTLPSQCSARCFDQSSVYLDVYIRDAGNQRPSFGQQIFNACVPIDAEIGREVIILNAVGADPSLAAVTVYSISELRNIPNTGDEAPADSFIVDETSGAVVTNIPLSPYEDQYFDMTVSAKQAGQTVIFDEAKLKVWVTTADKEVTLTVNQGIDVVEQNLDSLISALRNRTNWGVVCVSGVRFHVTEDGIVTTDRTDITLHIVDGSSNQLFSIERILELYDNDFLAAHGILFIKESYSVWDGFNIDPVLGAIIAIGLLLLLALLLLCCLFWLLAACCAKEKRIYHVAEAVNPVWKMKRFYEDQELCMAVMDTDDKMVTMQGTYNQGFEEAKKEEVDGTAKLVLPGSSVVKETREERHFEMTSFQETKTAQKVADDGAASVPRIETTLTGSAPVIAPPIQEPVVVNSDSGVGTASVLLVTTPPSPKPQPPPAVTESIYRYEKTSRTSHATNGSSLPRPSENTPPRQSRIGAHLTAPVHGHSTLGSNRHSADMSIGYDPAWDHIDADHAMHRLSSAPPVYRQYASSLPDDRRTEHSFTPSWAGDDLPDGLYQGEIHLGTMHSGEPSHHDEGEGFFDYRSLEEHGPFYTSHHRIN